MALPGSQSALRGYRLQHLYTLYRLFRAAFDDVAIQLEGSEDVDIFDMAGSLVEAVQVKALGTRNVTASTLFSEDDSFFHRAHARLAAHPKAIQKVVSFGPFGPELTAALRSGSPQRTRLKAHLQKKGLKAKQIDSVLGTVRLEQVDEAALTAEVMQRLENSVTTADPEIAFMFLSGWLFLAMEGKSRITAADLRQRLNAVGEFITLEALKRHEWYVNIVPLDERLVSEAERARLSEEFYKGTYTRYEHIAADLDVNRASKLDRIDQAFTRNNAIVVHGASGQGKTSLAYRYLRDRAVGSWCVEVRLLEDAPHALQVARVLAAHAKAMGVRMVAYVDVAPRNLNWSWMVRELAGMPNVRVLVTLRAEDWARAKAEGMQFEVADVELGFDEAEAQDLYDALVQKKPPQLVLDFREAWAKFGGGGPLMEFAYLVTQSEALRERLASQVRRLREEVRLSGEPFAVGRVTKSEVELLRRVAVASGYGARVSLDRLDDDLYLPDITATLALFEREYLLRLSANGRFLEGLHPIRSVILAELLTEGEVLATWARTACACLQAIPEADIYGFLLHSFSRRGQDTNELLAALCEYHPKTWTGLAGTFRALLWLGLRDYSFACKPLIDDAEEKMGSRVRLLLPLDPADIGSRWPDLFPRWEEMDWVREEFKLLLPGLRARIPNKGIVSAHARAWVSTRNSIEAPKTNTDWRGAAEVTFWTGFWNIHKEMSARFTASQFKEAAPQVPLDIAADILLALSFRSHDFSEFTPAQAIILDRFRQEMLVPVIEDDGHTVKAHFIVGTLFENNLGTSTLANEPEKKENSIHSETMRRIDLLRGITPTHSIYACQGYGHRTSLIAIPHDDTIKHIPSRNLPPRWLPAINGTLSELIDLNLRPDSWTEYAKAVHILRRRVVDHLGKLRDTVQQYFRKQDSGDILYGHTASSELGKMRDLLGNKPELPRSAVDEWGLGRESEHDRSRHTDGLIEAHARPRQHYSAYRESFNLYAGSLLNFYSQIEPSMAINPRLGRIKDPHQREAIKQVALRSVDEGGLNNRLSVINLHDALERLPRFQRLFKERFSTYFNASELDTLESQERDIIFRLWCVWYQFAYHPNRVSAQIAREAVEAFERPRDEARRRLRKYFKRFEDRGLRISILSEDIEWEDKKSLWISIDVDDPLTLHTSLEIALQGIQESIPRTADPTSISHYSYDHFWNQVQVVPLFRGKIIDQEMWHFPWLVLPRPEDDPQNVAMKLWPHPIPEATRIQLGLRAWSLDRLDIGRRFKATFIKAWQLIEHVLCLRDMPELDVFGQSIIKQYGRQQMQTVFDTYNSTGEALLEMVDYINSIDPEHLIDRPMLAEIMQVLPDLSSQLQLEPHRNDEQTDIEFLEAWCERLRAALPLVEGVRLAWISDVLDESVIPPAAG